MTEQQPELLPDQIDAISPADQAKREEYHRRLAEYLKDPAFRAIEGFPIGTDEDILALSDPPYYTACPNPFLPEIIADWQLEREKTREKLGLKEDLYQREPFAADVSEGKSDPIYNAHSYHTKVPHKAIMHYLLHYTDPGDIVLDGFCGTGMTGVAAQLCGDRKAVESLGFRVDEKEQVLGEKGEVISQLGSRKAIVVDLSPAATFLTYNYNLPVDVIAFEREAQRILRKVENECSWMYETWHPHCDDPKKVKAEINYTIWSEVLSCPHCSASFVYYDEFFDADTYAIKNEIICPNCSASLSKNDVELVYENVFDENVNSIIESPKRVPVTINYKVGKKTYNKKPDSNDLEVIKSISASPLSKFIPRTKLPDMQMMRVGRMKPTKITFIHQFFLPRSAQIMAKFWEYSQMIQDHRIRSLLSFWVESQFVNLSVRNRYRPGVSFPYNPLSGVFYVPSMISEASVIKAYRNKIDRISTAMNSIKFMPEMVLVETTSTSDSKVTAETIDYIFTDPPFGENIYYSDLNYFTESWFKVFTNSNPEAIVDRAKRKTLIDYQHMMAECFLNYFRALKPGRWMTVEFHNSQNSVWNAIQQAIISAGFVIADVRVLDKKQRSFQQVVSLSAVKQDLIISAYKANGNLEENFRLKAGTEDGTWEFVRYHLGKLPVVNESNGTAIVNAERQAFLLFDRMVAFHIQRGVMVPISSPEFYAGLEQRFTRRDGMFFLPDQVAEYDRAVLDSGKPTQLSLFVSDEKTAITWLRQQLDPSSAGEPKTQGDLTNDFNRIMNRAKHEQPLELIEILKQNFLQDEAGKWYVPDHNKATDLEKVRQRTLLKEFKDYSESSGRLRQFRTEAVRAGFADCFKRQEYETIVTVAERLPEDVLREDPDLLMYYDSALLRKK
jgi:DNA modification methylase